MQTNSQQPDVISAFDPLKLTDLSVGAGEIDPEQLVATYAIDPSWVGLAPILGNSVIYDLNGATMQFRDADRSDWLTLTTPDTIPPLMNTNRYYQAVSFFWSNTAVSSIMVDVGLAVSNAPGSRLLYRKQVNLSSGLYYTLGPIFVPAGTVLDITTQTYGGAGQTLYMTLVGYATPRGVAPPLIPAMVERT